ncbi:MAG TPA: hypothetical protein VIH85_27395 [Solirubrobacteraceae bacterium]|jgi:CheY-like chemotaxis protein
MLKKLTEEMGELVKAVTSLADRALEESAEARELAREDRATIYRLIEENVQAREAAAAAAERHSEEALAAFRARRADTPRLPVMASVADDYDAAERLEQRELVLTYDAWRTMLGRTGTASMFQADREFGDDDDPDKIWILAGHFEETGRGWTLVVTTEDGKVAEADVPAGERPPRVVVPVSLPRVSQIRRLEIRDGRGYPLYLGLGPALQTQNRQLARGGLPVARADDEDR